MFLTVFLGRVATLCQPFAIALDLPGQGTGLPARSPYHRHPSRRELALRFEQGHAQSSKLCRYRHAFFHSIEDSDSA